MSVVASFIAGISSGALCVYAIQDSVSIRRSNQGDRLEYAILGKKARPVRSFIKFHSRIREKNDTYTFNNNRDRNGTPEIRFERSRDRLGIDLYSRFINLFHPHSSPHRFQSQHQHHHHHHHHHNHNLDIYV